MKKIVFTLLLCACMVCIFLPATALAANAPVQIGGVDLPAGKYLASNSTAVQDNAPASGGYAHLSADGATLYLNDFELTDYAGQYGIYIYGVNIILDLTGESEVSNTGAYEWDAAALYADYADLTVQGGGSLTAVSNASSDDGYIYGFYIDNDLMFNSGTLHGEGAYAGICCGDITVTSGKLTGEGSSYGIMAYFDILVSGGDVTGEIADDSVEDDAIGISCDDLAVTSGKLTGNGYSIGVCATSVSISGGETTGYATGGEGLHCDGRFSVSSGTVCGEGNVGIAVGVNGASPQLGAVDITGGEVTGEGGRSGIGLFATGNVPITISGGITEFTGEAGISLAQGASIEITSGAAKFVGTGFRAVFLQGGNTFDLSGYTETHTLTVSKNANGSSPEAAYNESDLSSATPYKYLNIGPVPFVLTDNATGDPAVLGADYTYDLTEGVLRVIKGGDYTLSMTEGVFTTHHCVVVNAQDSAQVKLTLNGVHIEGAYSAIFSGSGGIGALVIASDTLLTLSGENSLTNSLIEGNGNKAYGVFLLDNASLELTGSGSLDVSVPDGTGIFLHRSKLLHISGGDVAITAKQGVNCSSDSSGDEANFNQYKQSSGSVTITASTGTAVSANVFSLSGGSLDINGTSPGTAINALYTTSVSGGELSIDGGYGAGMSSYKIADDEEAGIGGISFTGGVTDINLGEGCIAIYSSYSDVTRNSINTDPSGAPALPQHQITLGANMRVTEGGSVVWSSWLAAIESISGVPEVIWDVYDTFSTGAAIIISESEFSGFSNRVLIEPLPSSRSKSYDYFTITATASEGGSIAPVGSISIREGYDKTFTLTPKKGYVIADILVDGKSVKNKLSGNSYTFENIAQNHSIKATFTDESLLNPNINPFMDIKESDWFFKDIMFVYEKGLMKGISGISFAPKADTNRAMLVTMLYRLTGEPAVTEDPPFSDVAADSYYFNAVAWAKANKIAAGIGDNLFNPNGATTREQLVTMLYNYAIHMGYDVSVGNNTNILSYSDALEVADWAVLSFQWACGAGILQGDGDKLMPQGEASRAELAAMIHRFIDSIS